VSDRASGEKWPESSTKCNHRWSSSKIHPPSPHADSVPFSPTLARSGTMQHGVFSELPQLEPLTAESECGFWPTPTVHGNYNRKGLSKDSGDGLATAVRRNNATPGPLNPEWVEWLMGWPTGWTALQPLATDKCLNVRH
jgi:DNA (cytosine-5)-methyltransferase 1